MSATAPRQAQRTALLPFILLAYGLSWLLWLPALLASWGVLALPPWVALAGNFGPGLAALVLAGAREGPDGLRRLLRQLGRWRVEARWYAAALAPLALTAALLAVFAALTGARPDLSPRTLLLLLPNYVFWLVVGGPLGEEIGWRGYLLPRLLATRSVLGATLVTAAVWWGWHLPRYLDPNFVAGGLANLVLFALQVVVFSILFTWLYRGTGGSLLLVVVFHAAINSLGNTYPLLFPKLDAATVAAYAAPMGVLLLGVLLVAAVMVLARRYRDWTRPPQGQAPAA